MLETIKKHSFSQQENKRKCFKQQISQPPPSTPRPEIQHASSGQETYSIITRLPSLRRLLPSTFFEPNLAAAPRLPPPSQHLTTPPDLRALITHREQREIRFVNQKVPLQIQLADHSTADAKHFYCTARYSQTGRRATGFLEQQVSWCHFRRLLNLAASSSISFCPLELAGGLVPPVSVSVSVFFTGGSSCLITVAV